MRFLSLSLTALLLTACTASVATGLEGELEHGIRLFGATEQQSSVFTVPVGVFAGRFSTTSAVNSDRTFGAEYYGILRVEISENGKIECDWSLDGRMKGVAFGGLLQAASSVCIGRLQPDGSFEFQGVYRGTGMTATGSGASLHPSFTMEGTARINAIEGSLVLGDVFSAVRGDTDPGAAFFIIPQN